MVADTAGSGAAGSGAAGSGAAGSGAAASDAAASDAAGSDTSGSTELQRLTTSFEAERARLFGLAYRMTSSVMDADDIVQEAWLRLEQASRREQIRDPAALLTTVTTRLAIDRLRAGARHRDAYVGPWLPEPILTDRDPSHLVELDQSVRMSFLTVLDKLGPVDRAVFLLHDVFGVQFGDVADTVGRSEATCRQIAKRARERVHAQRPPQVLTAARRRELLDAFLGAVLSGDFDVLQTMLADDVVLTADGGREVRAARQPVRGPHRLSRFLVNLAKRIPPDSQLVIAEVNGEIGVVTLVDEQPLVVYELEFRDDVVHRVHSVSSHIKLRALRNAWSE